MPNKTHNYKVDVLPDTTNTYNLGDATKKWKINGVTPGDAMAKSVDSSISSGSTSTNLPTSQAVATYVEGQGYLTDADVASETDPGILSTGAQSIAGRKSFVNGIAATDIYSDGLLAAGYNYRITGLSQDGSPETAAYTNYFSYTTSGDKNPRFIVGVRSRDSSTGALLTGQERYVLPSVDTDLSSLATYDIYTSKDYQVATTSEIDALFN